MVHRGVMAVLCVPAAWLALAGCSSPAARARLGGIGDRLARPAALQATGPAEEAAAAPRPNWAVRYCRHRWDDFRDIFGLNFAVAPPWQMYGFDASVGLADLDVGLGYMKGENAFIFAAEGRGAYAQAPYRRNLWRLLFWSSDEETVDVASGIGNVYVKPEAFADAPNYPYYEEWVQVMAGTGPGSAATQMPFTKETAPAQRLVPNSERDGPYTACPDGWQRHIGAVRLELAIPGDPLVLKFATKMGINLNWCQTLDFLTGLVCFDYYGDDVYGRPGIPGRLGP
ncbi:MAG: hypothetical protein ACOC8A_01045 [bacterium]